ncbi:MAG: hypothetical protein Q8O47_05840 [Candidatus Bathyarchaeota archaeon]|nr:hypothetical protein [Candidatus Bathyarchaeota archaeon]
MRQIVGDAMLAVLAAVALLAMLWGWTYSVPDLVRVSYGLPLNWGENTLETIAGPVDRWSVNLTYLAIDLVFWFAALIALDRYISIRR